MKGFMNVTYGLIFIATIFTSCSKSENHIYGEYESKKGNLIIQCDNYLKLNGSFEYSEIYNNQQISFITNPSNKSLVTISIKLDSMTYPIGSFNHENGDLELFEMKFTKIESFDCN